MNPSAGPHRVLRTIASHWRSLLVVAVLAAGSAALLSGPAFIVPRYLSTAIVYPVNLEPYAEESRTDQLLQLYASNSIRDSLITRFGLAEDYRIDTTVPPGHAYLYNLFNERVSIEKTRYESVQVEVEDEDPRQARDMVVALLHQGDLLARRLQREKTAEVLAIAQDRMTRNQALLDSVEHLLDTLRRGSGMLDYGAQSQELVKGYMRLLARSGGEAQKQEVRGMIDALERDGGAFKGLTRLGDILRERYAGALAEYEALTLDMAKELTYSNVVVHPEVPDKKVYPVRWFVVLISTLSALLVFFLLIAWRDGLMVARPQPSS